MTMGFIGYLGWLAMLFISGALFALALSTTRRAGHGLRAFAAVTAWGALLIVVALGAADSLPGVGVITGVCVLLGLIVLLPRTRASTLKERGR